MVEPSEIEKKSLEAHVELCAERYNALHDTITSLDKKITDICNVVKEVKDKNGNIIAGERHYDSIIRNQINLSGWHRFWLEGNKSSLTNLGLSLLKNKHLFLLKKIIKLLNELAATMEGFLARIYID